MLHRPVACSSPQLASLSALLRCFSSARPGQPTTLHTYDKGLQARPPPRHVVDAQAAKMGRRWSAALDGQEQHSVRLSVPRSPHEFALQRSTFRRRLGALRKDFAAEWVERRGVEGAATAAAEAASRAAKAERDAVRGVQRAVALEAQAQRVRLQQAARAARRAVAASTASQGQAQLAELRAAWLAELEADARTWVTPERIDEMITPALFSQKFGWQWEDWFSGKELKRQLREDARRNRRPGVPLTEVALPPTLQPYAEDWESGEEDGGGGGEGEEAASTAQAPASAEAARHASPSIATALAAAREAARARGSVLAEPGYGPDGAALPAGNSAEDLAALRMREAQRAGGVPLVELASGAQLAHIIQGYEAWLEGRALELEKGLAAREEAASAAEMGAGEEGEAAAGSMNGAPSGSMASRLVALGIRDVATGRVILDDGERPLENAYIAACLSAANVEALYYALLRKRARLQGEAGYAAALAAFEGKWGAWLSGIEVRGGV